MANFWGKLFGQKESPALQARIGEGMTPEQTKKAYETFAKPDTAMQEAKANSFWGKTQTAVKEAFTPVETDVRFPFQAEPIKVEAAPITKVAARATYDLIEVIPRFVATMGGEFAAGFQPKEVKANIDLRRFGFDKPEYVTASKEFTDAVNNGDNPWEAGLRIVSTKALDVAFGASMITDLAKMSTALLLKGGAEARVEAQNVVDAIRANKIETFQRLKNAPLEQRERALAEITNTKHEAEKVLRELGKPTAADKLKIKASRYTEVLGRETPITKNFWGDFAKPDISLKTGPVTKAPLLEVKQLPGTRETPGQAPSMGLSMKKVEQVGKEESRLAVSKELANYEAAPLTVNGKPYIADVDAEFTLSQLKDKDASGKTLTDKEIKAATEAFAKIGIDPFKAYPAELPKPEVPKYQSLENFINEKPVVTEDPLITEAKKHENITDFLEAQQRERNILYRGSGDGYVGDNQFYGDFYSHAEDYAGGSQAIKDGEGVVTGFEYNPDDVFYFDNRGGIDDLRNAYSKLTDAQLKEIYSKPIKDGIFYKAIEEAEISENQVIPLVKKWLKGSNDEISNDFLVALYQKYAKSKGKNIIAFEGNDFGGSTEYVVADIKKLTNLNEAWNKSQVKKTTSTTTNLADDVKNYKTAEDFANAEVKKLNEYKDGHVAPSADNTPTLEKINDGGDFSLDEVSKGFSNQPDDYFYPNVGARYYMYDTKQGQESYKALKPILDGTKSDLIAYRSIPKDVDQAKLQDGDWITFSKTYAKNHGDNRFDGKYKVIEQTVNKKDVWWDGNDINEWGYDTGKTWDKYVEIWNKANGVKAPKVAVVPEKSLVTIHNLSEQKLMFAHKIGGGLANPSMAVIDPRKTSFDNYGEITLVANPSLIKGEKTHLADAYSPRFPSVHTSMKWDDFRRLEKDLQPWTEKVKELGASDYSSQINYDDTDMVRNLEHSPAIALKFIEEKGLVPSPEGYTYFHSQIQEAGLDGEFQNYLDQIYKDYNLEEKMFAGYTNSGQRRYKPLSVYEASKIMGKQTEEGMNYGLGSYRSKIAPVKKSLADIKKEAKRLVSKEDFEIVKDKYWNELSDLQNKLTKYAKIYDSNSFIENDNQLNTIGMVLGGERDAMHYFNQKFPDVPEKIMNEVIAFREKLRTMPTEYFETKFKRPVYLSEFKKAIVPETISKEARKILELNGLEIQTYPKDGRGRLMTDLLKGEESFRKTPIFNKDVKMGSKEVYNIIFKDVEKAGYTKDDLKVLFTDEVIDGNSLGSFEKQNRWLGDVVRLYEKEGKVGIVTALHESKHFLFSKLSPELQNEARALAKERMGVLYRSVLEKAYKDEGLYSGADRENALLEEYIVDKWSKAQATAEHGYNRSIYSRIFEALDKLVTKIAKTYNKIKETFKSLPNKQGGFVRIMPEPTANIEGIKDQISFLEGSLAEHPGKILMKYVSKTTGLLLEITGKQTMLSLTGSGKEVKTGKFGREGDSILQEIAGYGKDPNEILQQYKNIKESVDSLKQQVKEAKSAETLQKISQKIAKHQEKMIQFAEKYPKLATLTTKLSEEATKGAIKGYKLGTEVASREIKKEVMTNIKTAYDKKVAGIKDNKEILSNRRSLIKAVTKQFGLSDSDLKTITQRDIRLMSNFEFKQFLDNIRAKSEEFMVRRQAQNELVAQINEKELNIEPLREAMKLPPISQMNTEQLRNLDATLEPYKTGDVFLSKRKLEVIDRTDLKDIKTYREAREILAKKIGVKPEDLDKIKIGEFDRFKGFSSLHEKDPFFKMVTEETTKLKLQAEAEYLAIEEQANKLAKKIKTSFIEKIIPQQKNIRAWFEAKDKSTVRLSKEEADLANFMTKEWGKARDELVIKEVMKRGIKSENYFTHIRRGILEAIKEDGLKQALKEIFDQYKLDEANFNILDQETGDVLAMDKFFRFALKRTGGLKPTENILGAFLSYMRTFKKKQALDEIVPLFDTYARALTPPGTTEKGLLLHADMIRFMKEWLNTQKGRRVNLLSKEGGKIDWALKSTKAFTTLLDIGLNLPVSVATQIGEQAIQYQLLGKGKFLKAKYRANTARGRRITNKYRNLVGKNPWTQLIEPMRSVGDRLNEGIFTLFQDANVRRNKNVMLGLMTKDEWANETISPERLAQMKIATGRYGVVEGLGSIIGATPESKIATQYKTWAIPILTSQVKNLTYMAKYLGTLGKTNKKEAARAFAEIWRMLELGAFTTIVAGAFVDKEDNSFLGKLKLRAIQEAYTLFGAAPAMATVPRMIGFLTDLANNTMSLLKLEEYKSSKFGEYEAGDLRGLEALQKQFTPRAVKQFDQVPVKTIDDIKAEIKADIESGALSVTAAKEKYVSELNKLKTADKKSRLELKPDEYKKDLAERIKNKEITVSDAKKEYLDYAEANVDSFKSPDEGEFIDKVILYAKAIGTDPVTASIYLFQGEKIRRIDNGAIIVERMPLEESKLIKKQQGATKDMNLDHTIPLQLGGSNDKSNLKLVNTDEWASYTPVENYLGNKLRAGMIDKKEAKRLIKDFKDGKISKEEIMK